MRGIAVVSGIIGLIATYTVGLNRIVTKKEYGIFIDSNLNRMVVGGDEIKNSIFFGSSYEAIWTKKLPAA